MRLIATTLTLCALAAATPTQIPNESAAVCQLSTGCTGICIDQRGIILSADHCGAPPNATATFDGKPPLHLTPLYDPPQDGIDQAAIFWADGDHAPLPHVRLAHTTPKAGDVAWSIGYPSEHRGKPSWEMHKGHITRTKFKQPGEIQAEDAIATDFPVWGGNSGGPLFNENGELIGLCSQSDRATSSIWIGAESIRNSIAAYNARHKTTSCPGGRCPNKQCPTPGVRIGPPIEINLNTDQPQPAPEPTDDQAGPIDDAYGLYKYFNEDEQPTPEIIIGDQPQGTTARLLMTAATAAGMLFGLKWLPQLAALLLSLFGHQVVKKENQQTKATAATNADATN